MGMKCAEDPFNMGMFFIPKASFIMSTFSDGEATHGCWPLEDQYRDHLHHLFLSACRDYAQFVGWP